MPEEEKWSICDETECLHSIFIFMLFETVQTTWEEKKIAITIAVHSSAFYTLSLGPTCGFLWDFICGITEGLYFTLSL